MTTKQIRGYHAHIYFEETTRSSEEEVRSKLIETFGDRIRVSRLVDEPIGPHPLPMFEVDFHPEEFASVVPWMMLHHKILSILVHPITGSDLADHRDHPIWIGKQLPLDLSIL